MLPPVFLMLPLLLDAPAEGEALERSAVQWGPALEWTLENPSFDGNPFDLAASAIFTHTESGETRRTGLFHAGGALWKFRFAATRTGTWTFETSSDDPDLDGRRGKVSVQPNPGPRARGCVTHDRNRWMWAGSEEAFVPQIVMYRSPDGYHGEPERIERDLDTWFVEHGFNGLHTVVLCRWFDIEKTSHDQFPGGDPDPDPRTFEALELLITRAHARGGFVHIWAWGDEDRRMTPRRWGLNGPADRRLQRYIAARLGPLSGWTMGYGFDLWEWVGEAELRDWHAYLHAHFGWPHLLGGRAQKNELTQIYEHLDFSSYEQHRPDYDTYVRSIEARPEKPTSSDDRFRVRRDSRWPEKDYDLEMTRRGLWHSAFAGGAGNIWGYLVPEAGSHGMSRPYPNRHQIRTYATFLEGRFRRDLVRANHLSDGLCLRRPTGAHYLFYKEDAERIRMDLSGMAGPQRAVAVDAKEAYRELDLGLLPASDQVWDAPRRSDWAVAVGPFEPSRGTARPAEETQGESR
jgi:hypothetical protein